MKKCTKCGIEKPSDGFHKRSKAKDGLQSWCKSCSIDVRPALYGKNSVKEGVRNRKWNKNNLLTNRFRLLEYFLEHPCVDCGETDPIVLEFDHKDSEHKEYNISSKLYNQTWETLLNEIVKCEVRCANCHRRKHNGNKYASLAQWSEQSAYIR